MALERLQDAVSNSRRRHHRALTELHPEVLARVSAVLADLNGQFLIWTGYRGKAEQQAALAAGRSRARWGLSPHNFKPAFAADAVLNPARLSLPPREDAPEWPDLWMAGHPAWAELERAAIRHHLRRVDVNGKRDLPHLELPGWWDMVQREGLTPG